MNCAKSPRDWGKTLKEMDLNLSFDLRVEPLSKYHLDDISMHRLRGGEIVATGRSVHIFTAYPT